MVYGTGALPLAMPGPRSQLRPLWRGGAKPEQHNEDDAIVVAQQIGTETITYVRNVYKYHVAYELTMAAQAEAERARRQVAPAKS